MDFPVGINLKDINMEVYAPSFYSESKSLIGHARAIPSSRFEVTFKTVALDAIKSREIWGFINGLNGKLNPFNVVLPTYSNSLGTIVNNPSIKAPMAAGNKIIRVKNLPFETDGLMVVGDVFKCAGHKKVYVLTKPLNSNSSGEGNMEFSPQLQKNVNVNELILVRKVPYSLRLRTEKSAFPKKVNDQGYVSFTFDTVEAL